MFLSEASDSDEVMAYLQKHMQNLTSLQAVSTFIASQQKAFGLPEARNEELKNALHEVRFCHFPRRRPPCSPHMPAPTFMHAELRAGKPRCSTLHVL
jgi:hypothetical protein